jgi:uridine phosphorylase
MTAHKLPITGLPVAGLPPDVLVCGDPARALLAGQLLDNSTEISFRREYRCFTGQFEGLPVTVLSHGVGAPGAAVAFEELAIAGARRIIRVGTCGGMQPDISAGALVLATAAVQRTGYGQQVTPAGYPAVADYRLVAALEKAAQAAGQQAYVGLVLTSDSFYPGVTTAATPDYQQLAAAGVLAVEMECAALFLVGSLRGVATAAILAVDGNVLAKRENVDDYRPHRPEVAAAVEAAIRIALASLRGREP